MITDVENAECLFSQYHLSETDTELSKAVVKLADFGCKKELKEILLSSFKGSIIYMVNAIFFTFDIFLGTRSVSR